MPNDAFFDTHEQRPSPQDSPQLLPDMMPLTVDPQPTCIEATDEQKADAFSTLHTGRDQELESDSHEPLALQDSTELALERAINPLAADEDEHVDDDLDDDDDDELEIEIEIEIDDDLLDDDDELDDDDD